MECMGIVDAGGGVVHLVAGLADRLHIAFSLPGSLACWGIVGVFLEWKTGPPNRGRFMCKSVDII
jgi:hypothetical protein